jgi:predicted transcriptional regulator
VKRDRFEIIAGILQVARNGAKKTHVMYLCNLSYSQTNNYLNHLLRIGFLRIGNSYHTTERGLRFLKTYEALELLLNTRD